MLSIAVITNMGRWHTKYIAVNRVMVTEAFQNFLLLSPFRSFRLRIKGMMERTKLTKTESGRSRRIRSFVTM
jgi:hypothetical protein